MSPKIVLPRFIPELDGLRALAILGVMFFHLQIPGFSLGEVRFNTLKERFAQKPDRRSYLSVS